jgi:hypothetical protein
VQYRWMAGRLRGWSDGAIPARGLGPAGAGGTEALPRGVVVLLGLACTVVAVAGLTSIADILAPVFLALMLTVTASPLGGRCLHRRYGQAPSIALPTPHIAADLGVS